MRSALKHWIIIRYLILNLQCFQFKIDQQNLDKVNDYIKDITFVFIKLASNRQGDEGKLVHILNLQEWQKGKMKKRRKEERRIKRREASDQSIYQSLYIIPYLFKLLLLLFHSLTLKSKCLKVFWGDGRLREMGYMGDGKLSKMGDL